MRSSYSNKVNKSIAPPAPLLNSKKNITEFIISGSAYKTP